MGPLDMVLAKDALSEILEKSWGDDLGSRVTTILAAGTEKELESAFKVLGLELMESSQKKNAWEFARIWKTYQNGVEASVPIKPIKGLAALDDDEDDEPIIKQSLAQGLAKGIGKAFAKSSKSTTEQLGLLALETSDNAGSVTHWQGEEELTAASKRMVISGKVGIALAKAELVAIVKSKLGSKANKLVERIDLASKEKDLAIAVGEAQRRLVRASMPRLAAKLAKKWLELQGKIE